MKKSIHTVIIMAVFLFSCNEKKDLLPSNVPLGYMDTVQIEPKQETWFYMVNDPSRGKIRVELRNYTDTAKTFVVYIKELENK